MADMERLVEERCIGIRTLGDLGDYYRRFIAITTFLCGTNRLSNIEQSRAFMRGLPCDLRHRVLQRLQLKLPDHFSDDPYCLSDVSDAAQFILYGTSTSVSITSTPYNPLISSTLPLLDVSAKNIAKHRTTSHSLQSTSAFDRTSSSHTLTPCDPLISSTSPLLDVSAKNIAKHRTMSQLAQSSSTFDRTSRNSPETPCCNFCGRPDHFIRQCPDAEEYIRRGRCRRTLEGKIALPTGSFVSRDVPGRFMKFRIDEWHRRNPGHLGSSRYTPRIVPNAVDPARCLYLSSPLRSRVVPTVETSNSGLSIPDRIKEIESELDQHRQSTRTTSTTSTLRSSPSHDVQHHSTSHTVPVTSILLCDHSALSPDIPQHSPALRHDSSLHLTPLHRPCTSDLALHIAHRTSNIAASTLRHSDVSLLSTDVPSHSPALRHDPVLHLTRPHRPITPDLASHIAHQASDIAASTLHHSDVSCTTSDISSSIPVDLARSFGLAHRDIVPYASAD